jgi:hypothetical protein
MTIRTLQCERLIHSDGLEHTNLEKQKSDIPAGLWMETVLEIHKKRDAIRRVVNISHNSIFEMFAKQKKAAMNTTTTNNNSLPSSTKDDSCCDMPKSKRRKLVNKEDEDDYRVMAEIFRCPDDKIARIIKRISKTRDVMKERHVSYLYLEKKYVSINNYQKRLGTYCIWKYKKCNIPTSNRFILPSGNCGTSNASTSVTRATC